MWNPQNGNRIIFAVCLVALAGLSLSLNWGRYSVRLMDLRYHYKVNGVSKDGTLGKTAEELAENREVMGALYNGRNGEMILGPISLPYWLSVASALAGLVLAILNLVRFSAVPSAIPKALLSLSSALLLIMVGDIVARGGWGSLHYGWLPLLASIIGSWSFCRKDVGS